MLKLGGEEIKIARNGDAFGVENLKDISSQILKALQKFKNRAKNGLNFWETIRTGLDFGEVGKEVLNDLDLLKVEVLDLSEPEMAELAEHIAKELDLELNVAFEAISTIVIETIDVILSSVSIYNATKTLLK